MDQKERALKKLRAEIGKDIGIAVDLAKQCGILELLYFVYYLHWVRLLNRFPNAGKVKKEVLSAYSNALEESIKYIISIIAKYGNWAIAVDKKTSTPKLNLELIQVLLKMGTYINSKYETNGVIQLFEVQVSGERDQHVKIDTSSANTNPDVRKLFDYFVRIDDDNNIKKNSKQSKEVLLQNFNDEYSPFADLFKEELGVTIEEFRYLIDTLLQKVTACIKSKEPHFEKLDNGNIDVTSQITFFHFCQCFLYDRKNLLSTFDKKFHAVIERLIFKPASFDESQLRFHNVTRQPILAHESFIILSPELLLDSVFTNIHYSLIESEATKDAYKAKQSSLFLNKLVSIANKYGFTEVEREKDLFEGKNQIGDIDLVLKDKNGNYILIEAKNHALPMDIYFKDVAKTKEHLVYLQSQWEKKVQKRIEHLKDKHENYSIPASYMYIVVSRFPEVISHYSNLFVVSIQEFEEWLKSGRKHSSFEQFSHDLYSTKEPVFTKEELEEMQKANIFFGRFEKE